MLALSSRLPILPVVIIAIAFLYVPQLTRVVRANVAGQFGEDYVSASQVMGARTWWILAKHVARTASRRSWCSLPCWSPTRSSSRLRLSFISAGITSVKAHAWGTCSAEGKILLLSGHWWTTFFPGLLILITTLSLNVLSEGLTDALASPDQSASTSRPTRSP